jgi:hypothetical protein
MTGQQETNQEESSHNARDVKGKKKANSEPWGGQG